MTWSEVAAWSAFIYIWRTVRKVGRSKAESPLPPVTIIFGSTTSISAIHCFIASVHRADWELPLVFLAKVPIPSWWWYYDTIYVLASYTTLKVKEGVTLQMTFGIWNGKWQGMHAEGKDGRDPKCWFDSSGDLFCRNGADSRLLQARGQRICTPQCRSVVHARLRRSYKLYLI